MKIIVTADLETHTKNGDVSTCEVRNVFDSTASVDTIIEWIDNEADKAALFILRSLGCFETDGDNNVIGCYCIKKNVTIKPMEEC